MALMDIFGFGCGRFGLRKLPITGKQAAVKSSAVIFAVLLLGVSPVCGEDYRLRISLSAEDFLGVCNQKGLNEDVGSWGECIGNFFSPVIPNPLMVLDPITGDNLKAKIDAINIFNFDAEGGVSGLLGKFFNIPLVLFYSILEVLASMIKYVLVFGFKFLFVYLFYVSLGFQSIILMLDSQTKGLDDVRKLQVTITLMGLASVVVLWYGGGWISW